MQIPVGHETYQANICEISGWDSLVLNQYGKNLFNKNAKNTDNGYIANQYLNFQGYPFTPSTTPENWFTSEYIYVKPNTKYTISGLATSSSNAPSICEYDSNKSFVIGYSYSNRENFTITTSSTTRFIRLSAGLGQTYWDTIQLEEGDSATSYNAYNGQTHTATFPDTVYGGSNDFASGKCKSEIGIYTIPEIEELRESGGNYYATLTISGIKSVSERTKDVICECVPQIDALGDYLGIYHIATNIVICVGSSYTVADFNQNIAGYKVAYPLATPTTITLTPSQIALLENNNVLWSDSNGNIKLKYFSKSLS